MWGVWRDRYQFFLEDGSRSSSSRQRHFAGLRPLQRRIAETREGGEDFDEAEKEALEAMLAGMLE